jgi:trans-aconitate methyltransferase
MQQYWTRFNVYLINAANQTAGSDNWVRQWRSQRMQQFLDAVNPPRNARIIDLGGTSWLWELIDHDFDLTLVNLHHPADTSPQKPCYHYVQGDATDLKSTFANQAFDVVFSNSVIEHVGDETRQRAFADEVKRLAPAYWVQTPSNHFPIEPHTHVPFYWQLPEFVKSQLKRSWRKELPEWTDMIEGTRVLTRQQMTDLFPEASLFIERKLGFEKSYAVFQPFR